LGPENLGKWIKTKASEVRRYLERLSTHPEKFDDPKQMLGQLSSIGKKLSQLNKTRKQE
jgi:hypothetical protein